VIYRLLVLLSLLAVPMLAPAQTVLSQPVLISCPSQSAGAVVSPWPNCPKGVVLAGISGSVVSASGAPTNGNWHSYAYWGASAVIAVCPAGARASADLTKCLNSAGGDATAWVVKSSLPALSTIGASTTNMALSWTPVANNTNNSALVAPPTYNVYRASCTACPCTGLAIVASSLTTPQHTDAGVTVGRAYTYASTAVVAGIESAQSPAVCTIAAPATGAAQIPAAPAALTLGQ
jgi:hypothetical protein